MYACIIMHNMIVESDCPELTRWTNEDAMGVGPSHGVATANARMGYPLETRIGSANLPTCAKHKPMYDFRMISLKSYGRGGVDVDILIFFCLHCNFLYI